MLRSSVTVLEVRLGIWCRGGGKINYRQFDYIFIQVKHRNLE